ncbi:MAG: single-stranded DNA-binding protein [Leptospirales bacterium]|nr:single-stranded DNA-binding protein [Leptospirales bacterium]
MNNLSLAVLDGNLTRDPEMKTIKTGKVVTTFTVAMNHEYGSKEGNKSVSYISIETWDKLAENCAAYLKKGSRVTVSGSIREDRWKDDEGKSHNRHKVVAMTVRFDSSKEKEKAAA